jgi:hypothetical protein
LEPEIIASEPELTEPELLEPEIMASDPEMTEPELLEPETIASEPQIQMTEPEVLEPEIDASEEESSETDFDSEPEPELENCMNPVNLAHVRLKEILEAISDDTAPSDNSLESVSDKALNQLNYRNFPALQ